MEDNYYTSLLQRIREAIDQEKLEEARRMLEEELSMPYVPSEILSRLQQLKETVDQLTAREKKLPLLEDSELAEYLRGNPDERYRALDSLSRSNIRNHLEVIRDYMADREADRLTVSQLLEQCMVQQVDADLPYWDEGEMHTCNPKDLWAPLDNDTVLQAWKKLTEMYENQDPSFLKMCTSVLIQYVYLHYPRVTDSDPENLANRVVKYVYHAYGDDDLWQRYAASENVNDDDVAEIIL